MTHQANTTVHTKARRAALENAQPGDIVLFHHARGWSRIITSFSGSRYYHVALYAGDQNVIESRVRGVSMRDVSQAKIRLYFRVIPAPVAKRWAAKHWNGHLARSESATHSSASAL